MSLTKPLILSLRSLSLRASLTPSANITLPIRTLTTIPARRPPPTRLPAFINEAAPKLPSHLHTPRRIKTYPPPPAPATLLPPSCVSSPIAHFTQTQLATLDPTGARQALFSRMSPTAAHVGDILLVRQKGGDPFAGLCLNIRRRGIDTSILLRNQLTRVGVEMWYKIYSPSVEGIEIVKRGEKRRRRARIYYMRKPEHDAGSVQGIVQQYLRQRAILGAGGKSKEAAEGAKGKKQGGKKKR